MTAHTKTVQPDVATNDAQRTTIRRTAIVLGGLAIAWYFGFMALRLL